jgi:glycolate oxidase FAD binding subunit
MDTVFQPSEPREVAAILAASGTDGRALRPRGSGTKLTWGAAAGPAEAYLSTRRLASPIQHFEGDLVATIPAGATLAEANRVLARHQQWLPLDPLYADQATIGGIVATNDSGPRRHHHGAPRDLIVGVEFALADGRVAKAGGRVVKNVAGYDLARLLCGSFGSLAVMTAATFKLAPLAPFSITLDISARDVAHAHRLALSVAAAPLAPSAVEIEAPTPRLLVRFETTERSARQQADVVHRMAVDAGADPRMCVTEEEADLWKQHERSVFRNGGVLFKVSVLPTDMAAALAELERIPEIEWSAIGRAALGLLTAHVSADVTSLVTVIKRLREHINPRGGSLFVLDAPAEVRAQVDVWGEVGNVALMGAVKARFDPRRVLSPGSGPGGL